MLSGSDTPTLPASRADPPEYARYSFDTLYITAPSELCMLSIRDTPTPPAGHVGPFEYTRYTLNTVHRDNMTIELGLCAQIQDAPQPEQSMEAKPGKGDRGTQECNRAREEEIGPRVWVQEIAQPHDAVKAMNLTLKTYMSEFRMDEA